jgi:hypothetical protein
MRGNEGYGSPPAEFDWYKSEIRSLNSAEKSTPATAALFMGLSVGDRVIRAREKMRH